MIVVAIIASIIFQSGFHLTKKWKERAHSEESAAEMESNDPFSDSPESGVSEGATIKVKFVEVRSGTEELPFDWIVPFQSTPGSGWNDRR